MWIKYVSVPVDAYKRILFFFEVCKLFLFQRTQAFKQLFCFFTTFLLKKAAVSTVLFLYLLIILLCFFFCFLQILFHNIQFL